jgi:hypothetical protein
LFFLDTCPPFFHTSWSTYQPAFPLHFLKPDLARQVASYVELQFSPVELAGLFESRSFTAGFV